TSVAASASSAPATSVTAPTRSPDVTKPPELQVQRPLAAPTHVSWGIDRGSVDDPQHRRLFELYFDGAAMGFRVVDASGQLVVQVPVVGHGVFAACTCMVDVMSSATVVRR